MKRILDDHDVVYAERDNDELWALCPNPEHSDTRPSWSVNATTGAHYCFSCGYGGHVVKLIADLEGHGSWERVESKAATYITFERAEPAVREAAEQSEQPPSLEPLDSARLAAFGSPPSSALEGRRITPEAANEYRIHYSRQSQWILPVYVRGDLFGWQVKQDRKGGRVWNYPKGVHTGISLYGTWVVSDGDEVGDEVADEVWVVESPLDAAVLFSLGYDAVATWGAGLTQDQFELLKRFPQVVLAFDNDKAGRLATDKAIVRLLPSCKVFLFDYIVSGVKDVGDMQPSDIHLGYLARFHATGW